MKKAYILFSGLILSLQTSPIFAVSPPQAQPKSFVEWCEQRYELPEDTRKTIEAVMQTVGASNCGGYDAQFKAITSLDLNSGRRSEGGMPRLRDLRPLATLITI
jgi:internalin A